MKILNEFFYQNSTRSLFEDQLTAYPFHVHAKTANITQYLEQVYSFQVENVRNFVANHPSHTLLEFDISNNSTGKILADAFGLKEDCWGHYNKNSGGGKAAKLKGHLDAMKSQAKKYKKMHEYHRAKLNDKVHKKQLSFYQQGRKEGMGTAGVGNKRSSVIAKIKSTLFGSFFG
jgi:hypothetical protein